jgi:hypothetical protein
MSEDKETTHEQSGLSRRDTLKLAAAVAAFGAALGIRPASSIAQGKGEGKSEMKGEGKTEMKSEGKGTGKATGKGAGKATGKGEGKVEGKTEGKGTGK